MNINYDRSSLEGSIDKDRIKEEKTGENESNEENEENSEDDNEESLENEDSHDNYNDYDVNQLIKELNETKYLYKQIENTLFIIKEALKKLFSNLVIPEKEEEIKNILKISGFKESEIVNIINKK